MDECSYLKHEINVLMINDDYYVVLMMMMFYFCFVLSCLLTV